MRMDFECLWFGRVLNDIVVNCVSSIKFWGIS